MIAYMDSSNPIVALCVEGMEQEMRGQLERASELFAQAWNQSSDDFEKCIAAHYLARHQKMAIDALRWNQESLKHANASDRVRVQEFYPSLYLNLGKSHEELGDREEARRFYQLAAESEHVLSTGSYRNTIQGGINRALHRVSG